MRPARLVLLLLGAVLALAPPAMAANADYDALNGVTLGDTPYASAAAFTAQAAFDNSGFTDAEEASNRVKYTGCGAWGAKTAWVRFATAVSGRAFVDVQSAGDVIYKVYAAPASIPPGTATINDLADIDCQNANHATPNESYAFGYAVPAGAVLYVQVLSVCADRTVLPTCSDEERAATAGGQQSLGFRFTPDNADGDAHPDSLDACPGTAGPVSGCPDADGDGVGEPADQCPAVPGRGADGCRLPDEDGDGFRADSADPLVRDCDDDRADVRPGATEVRGNTVDENCDGLAAFDRDGDGHDDAPGPDCDPADPAVHPGARDVPGNGRDEDCDGPDARFPRVDAAIAPSYLQLRGRTVGFASFKVLPAVKGMRIRIECRGRGCPYAAKTHVVRRNRPGIKVGREFDGRKLSRRARVTVKVMRKGHVGRALIFKLHAKKGPPRIVKRCTAPGGTSVVGCGSV